MRKWLSDEYYWFAPLSPETGKFDESIAIVGNHRYQRAAKDLKNWVDRVGLPYHSPHKFRHGNAVYGIKNSQDVGDLKAVSQNLMHSNLSITDGVYGILSNTDLRYRINGLGKQGVNEKLSNNELADLLMKLARQLKGTK